MNRLERCEDAWADVVDRPGGTLLQAVDPETQERADTGAALRTSTDGRGEAYGLGLVELDGRLVVCDAVTLSGFELGVSAPRGRYPTYVVMAEGFAELLVVRLGRSYPSRWQEVGDDVYGGTIPIDSGAYALAGAALVNSARNDSTIRSRLDEASAARVLGPIDVDQTLGGAVVNTEIGGDVPAWCYLGLDAENHVVAVAITLVTDYIFGNRPSSEDAELLRTLIERAEALAEDEEVAEEWSDVKRALESANGRITFEIRASLHSLDAALQRAGG